jgi:hypothetical protein
MENTMNSKVLKQIIPEPTVVAEVRCPMYLLDALIKCPS